LIIFTKVRWKNLLSTGNQWTEVEISKTNTTLIVGINGSGKSTLIDAISFCLFNKPFRKINKPQLVNTITNKNLVVEVEFTLGQTNYKIVRGIKPAIFEIYQNDQLINQDAANRDYQEIVEKHILKINHKSFCQVVILGSSNYVPFMQLPAQARREIIEDLLDLQIFTVMNTVLKQKIEDNDNDFWQTEQNTTLLKEKIKIIEEHIKEVQADNEVLIQQKQGQIYLIDNNRSIVEQDISSLTKVITETEAAIKVYDDPYEKLRGVEKIESQLEHRIDSGRKMIKFLTDENQCPTCKQDINHQFKHVAISNKMTTLQELEKGREIIVKKKDKLLHKIETIKVLMIELNDFKLKLSQCNLDHQHMTSNIENINVEINQIKQKQNETSTERVDQYQKELEQEKEKYNNLQEQRQVYDILQYVLKDGGIKSKIIKQYVPVINKYINKYLSSMDFFVDFSLDENFEETIKSRNRDIFSYESFSEGEKFRINLAVLFAWRSIAKLRNSINTNLLIMDEVMDSSLDQAGTEEFLKILLQLTKDTNTFIISHKTDALYDKFDRVLEFQKKKNFSMVKEG